MNKEIGILGMGEIGQSIYDLYRDKFFSKMPPICAEDIEDMESFFFKTDLISFSVSTCEILHICIPFTNGEDFYDTVCQTIDKIEHIEMVIIHSTVNTETTEGIKCNYPLLPIAHCPVIGVHPNLMKGLQTFKMFVGCDNIKDSNFICRHLNLIGIKTVPVLSRASALLKLMSTTYYGVCIAYHAEMNELCKYFSVDFNLVKEWTENYNNGYASLGMDNVTRPNLYWDDKGSIGGHCIIPNVKMLKEIHNSPAFDLIMKYSGEKKK